MVRHDYRCNGCGNVFEDITDTSAECPVCSSHNTTVVFTRGSVQYITKHASTVEHVFKKNREQMEQVYEEDATSGSEFQKQMTEMRDEASNLAETKQ